MPHTYIIRCHIRTFYVGNALVQDLLQGLGILQLLHDLADDALGQLSLLTLLDLSLVPDPRVQDLFGFRDQGRFLFELEGFGFQLCRFLRVLSAKIPGIRTAADSRLQMSMPYLGNLKESLRNINNPTKLLNTLNSRLHRGGMILPRRVQDPLHLIDLPIRPILIHRPAIPPDRPEHAQQAERNDGFLVQHVQLVADGRNRETGTGGQDGGFGCEIPAG